MHRGNWRLMVCGWLASFGLVLGCRTPPPEITVVETPIPYQPINAEMLRQLGEDIVSNIQLYISNQVMLFREQNELRGRNTGEALELVSSFSRDTITIDSMTKGAAIRFNPGDMSLDVSFEQGREQTLRFIQTEHGIFELDIYDGVTLYNGVPYRVLAAERPMLLIKLENRGDITERKRRVPGRSVEKKAAGNQDTLLNRQMWPEAGAASPAEPVPRPEAAPPARKTVPEQPSMAAPPAGEAFPEYAYTAESLAGEAFPEQAYTSAPLAGETFPEQAYTSAPFAGETFPEQVYMAAPPPVEPAASSFPTVESPMTFGAPVSGSRRGETCRVQVGAFTSMNKAREVIHRLIGEGFYPEYEQHNEYYRVIISRVIIDDIDSIIRRLYSAGFPDPWVREEE